jgi:hypothetical protein
MSSRRDGLMHRDKFMCLPFLLFDLLIHTLQKRKMLVATNFKEYATSLRLSIICGYFLAYLTTLTVAEALRMQARIIGRRVNNCFEIRQKEPVMAISQHFPGRIEETHEESQRK